MEKSRWRFNRGVIGRGKEYFNAEHCAQIRRMLAHYAIADSVAAALVA
jgi:hypothetical protein